MDEISQFNNGWTDEENERFLSYIRQHWLVAPSQGPLNISLTVQDPSQHGQGEYVDKVKKTICIHQLRNLRLFSLT